MNAEYVLGEVQPDGRRIMTVNGKDYLISPQSLPDQEWALKLQLKANLFSATQ